MRYPLIDFHGSNGNMHGDGPAAYRYTESRLSKLTEDGLLFGIKKKNVDFIPNYSETKEEPVELPAIFPNLLCNPNSGIGVACASSWASHNLKEVAQAINDYINGKEPMLPGPDFPTGGIVINKDDVPKIMKTGHGSVRIRGKYHLENNNIVFTEIPYGETTETLMLQIGEACDKEEIIGINDIRNESSKKGFRLVIEYDKNSSPEYIVNQLFAKTNLQSSFSYNQIALINKTPTELNLKDCIKIYVDFNSKCIIKEVTFDINKAEERLHIINGLLRALQDIDEIITTIKKSESVNVAREQLQNKWNFSNVQTEAILNMKLSKLAKLEKVSLETEKIELEEQIQKLKAIKENPIPELQKRLSELVNKYGDERRTELLQLEVPKTSKPTFIPKDIILGIDNHYNIKVIDSLTSFKTKRNKENYQYIIKTSTDKNLIVFMADGKTYKVDLKDIEKNLNSIAILSQSGKIIDILEETNKKYLMFITKNGMLKKTPIEEYKNIRRNGTAAIKLKDGDEVRKIHYIDFEPIIIITENGQTIYFDTSTIKPVGRAAMGVIGIKLKEEDNVASFSVVENKEYMLTVSTNGNAKKTLLSEYTKQNRGGVGIIGYKCPNGDKVADILNVNEKDTIIIYNEAKLIKISCSDVPTFGRNSQGNHIGKYGKITNINII